ELLRKLRQRQRSAQQGLACNPRCTHSRCGVSHESDEFPAPHTLLLVAANENWQTPPWTDMAARPLNLMTQQARSRFPRKTIFHAARRFLRSPNLPADCLHYRADPRLACVSPDP